MRGSHKLPKDTKQEVPGVYPDQNSSGYVVQMFQSCQGENQVLYSGWQAVCHAQETQTDPVLLLLPSQAQLAQGKAGLQHL